MVVLSIIALFIFIKIINKIKNLNKSINKIVLITNKIKIYKNITSKFKKKIDSASDKNIYDKEVRSIFFKTK